MYDVITPCSLVAVVLTHELIYDILCAVLWLMARGPFEDNYTFKYNEFGFTNVVNLKSNNVLKQIVHFCCRILVIVL